MKSIALSTGVVSSLLSYLRGRYEVYCSIYGGGKQSIVLSRGAVSSVVINKYLPIAL